MREKIKIVETFSTFVLFVVVVFLLDCLLFSLFSPFFLFAWKIVPNCIRIIFHFMCHFFLLYFFESFFLTDAKISSIKRVSFDCQSRVPLFVQLFLFPSFISIYILRMSNVILPFFFFQNDFCSPKITLLLLLLLL